MNFAVENFRVLMLSTGGSQSEERVSAHPGRLCGKGGSRLPGPACPASANRWHGPWERLVGTRSEATPMPTTFLSERVREPEGVEAMCCGALDLQEIQKVVVTFKRA